MPQSDVQPPRFPFRSGREEAVREGGVAPGEHDAVGALEWGWIARAERDDETAAADAARPEREADSDGGEEADASPGADEGTDALPSADADPIDVEDPIDAEDLIDTDELQTPTAPTPIASRIAPRLVRRDERVEGDERAEGDDDVDWGDAGGAPAPAPVSLAAHAAHGQLPAIRPLQRRRRGRVGALAAGLVAVAVIGIAAVVVVFVLAPGWRGSDARSTPEKVASSYLSALVRGDATTANRLAGIGGSGEKDRLLSDAVLGKSDRITSAIVRTITRDESGSVAMASVRYRLAGQDVDDVLQLKKSGGEWGVSRGLVVDFPALSVTVATFSVGGSAARLDPAEPDVRVYPGVYRLSPAMPLFEFGGDATVTVAGGSAKVASDFSVMPSALFVSQVQKAMDDRFQQCAASTTLQDAVACGIAFDQPAQVVPESATLAVSIVQQPTVATGRPGTGSDFQLTGGVFSGTLTGRDAAGDSVSEIVPGRVGALSPHIEVIKGEVKVSFG